MIVARSSSDARLRRASSSSSLTAAPAARTSSRPVAFELPDVGQGGEALGGGGLPDDVLVVGGLAEGGDGAGIAQVPGNLGGGGGLVDRHRDGAGEPDGEVDQRPFVPGAGHDAHPVAGGDAAGHQALGEQRDVGQEIGGPDVLPLAGGVQPGEQGRVGGLGGLAQHQVRDVRFRGDVDQGRDTDFSHDSSFDIHRPARGTTNTSMRSAACVFHHTYWRVTLRFGSRAVRRSQRPPRSPPCEPSRRAVRQRRGALRRIGWGTMHTPTPGQQPGPYRRTAAWRRRTLAGRGRRTAGHGIP